MVFFYSKCGLFYTVIYTTMAWTVRMLFRAWVQKAAAVKEAQTHARRLGKYPPDDLGKQQKSPS